MGNPHDSVVTSNGQLLSPQRKKKSKDIFIIFECDSHRSFDSHTIKGIYTGAFRTANASFKRTKKVFLKDNSSNWILNIGKIAETELNKVDLDTNMLRDITIIDSTEE